MPRPDLGALELRGCMPDMVGEYDIRAMSAVHTFSQSESSLSSKQASPRKTRLCDQ